MQLSDADRRLFGARRQTYRLQLNAKQRLKIDRRPSARRRAVRQIAEARRQAWRIGAHWSQCARLHYRKLLSAVLRG